MSGGLGGESGAVLVLYHSVGQASPDGSHRFSVTEEQFRRHLQLIREAVQAGTLAAATLAEWWAGGVRPTRGQGWGSHEPQPGRASSGSRGGASVAAERERGPAPVNRPAVVLCFDDGGRTDYERALPLLVEAGLPATFFVNPGLIGVSGYLDWVQVRAMAQAGMEIESHGFHHDPLSSLGPQALEAQLRRARHSLQEHIGKPVQFLAAPYGAWNRRVLETALATGHKALCISRPGVMSGPQPVVARMGVRHRTSARQLQGWLQFRLGSYAGLWIRDRALWLPKHILSPHPPSWTAPAFTPEKSGAPSSPSTF